MEVRLRFVLFVHLIIFFPFLWSPPCSAGSFWRNVRNARTQGPTAPRQRGSVRVSRVQRAQRLLSDVGESVRRSGASFTRFFSCIVVLPIRLFFYYFLQIATLVWLWNHLIHSSFGHLSSLWCGHADVCQHSYLKFIQ